VTEKRRWFTDDEYMEGLGLAQLLPGAPSVNLSSYLGFRLRGLPGAVVATVCFLTPCFLLMLLLSYLYLTYGEMPVVSGLFRGLGALVVGLVFNTILDLWRSGVKTVFNGLMAFAGFVLIFRFKWGREYTAHRRRASLPWFFSSPLPLLARWTGGWSGLWKKGSCIRQAPAPTPPGSRPAKRR
jgi:chromate transport protein ChrA